MRDRGPYVDVNLDVNETSAIVYGAKEEGKSYHRTERRHGKFRRVIALPKDVAADKIQARYENGVLVIVVPKAEASMARKIEIK